jgi:uncharacterized protein YjbI with pentapeptide repeats
LIQMATASRYVLRAPDQLLERADERPRGRIASAGGNMTGEHDAHVAAVYVSVRTVEFEGAALESFVIPGVRLPRGKSFRSASLYGTMMAGADLRGCDFEGADLRGANLDGAMLVGANLRGANLSRDNLGGSTYLLGADLTNAILEGTNLEGARFNSHTVFPTRFDPEAAGMLIVDAG